jgi:hypothetical protein
MSEASDQLYTFIFNRFHPLPHSYIPTTTSATINARKRPRSPDSSHSQYPNTRLRYDAPPFVPKPPITRTRTQKRQLRKVRIFPNPKRKTIDGKSDNARIRIARQPLRKRLRLLRKIKEVHIVAETLNVIASHRFQALCNLIGISTNSSEQQPRRMVNAHFHAAPLRYPKIELPLDGAAAWKLLKKHQVAGRISKQRFRTLLDRHIAHMATS